MKKQLLSIYTTDSYLHCSYRQYVYGRGSKSATSIA